MYVVVTGADGAVTATARDMDDLRTLEVRLVEVEDDAAQAALAREGLGSLDGEHAWLESAVLRARGPATATWRADFDAMLEYAADRGWCCADRARVRAHLVRS